MENNFEHQPKEIVYATTNEAKLHMMQNIMGENYRIISLKKLGIEIQAEEDGSSPSENALKKAIACFKQTGKPSFAVDYGFFIEGLKDNEQPGHSVKRIISTLDGKEPTDDDVLTFYTSIVRRLGGKVDAYWLRAVAFVSNQGEFIDEIKIPKVLVDTPSTKRVVGFPMTSIQLDPHFNKYESEMTDEEKKESAYTSDLEMKDFIIKFLG